MSEHRWEFIDIDENIYEIIDPTFTMLEESNPAESDILERSFSAGAQNPGIIRDTSKEITFQYTVNQPVESDFRDYVNEFLYNARKAVKIKDTETSREIEVNFSDHVLGYDVGGFKLGAQNSLTFTALTPYWEDDSFTTDSDSTSTTVSIIVNNLGWVETNPIFTITASAAITKFSIRNLTTGRGILIQDLQFGLLGLTTYIINCVDGTSELNGISREGRIKGGTGFFSLPVGISTVEFTVTGQADVEIKYKKRYYI